MEEAKVKAMTASDRHYFATPVESASSSHSEVSIMTQTPERQTSTRTIDR